jgi:hypothetical protein
MNQKCILINKSYLTYQSILLKLNFFQILEFCFKLQSYIRNFKTKILKNFPSLLV